MKNNHLHLKILGRLGLFHSSRNESGACQLPSNDAFYGSGHSGGHLLGAADLLLRRRHPGGTPRPLGRSSAQ